MSETQNNSKIALTYVNGRIKLLSVYFFVRTELFLNQHYNLSDTLIAKLHVCPCHYLITLDMFNDTGDCDDI